MKFEIVIKSGPNTLTQLTGVRRSNLKFHDAAKIIETEEFLEHLTGYRFHINMVALEPEGTSPKTFAKAFKCEDCRGDIAIEPGTFDPEKPLLCQKCDPAFSSLLDNKYHKGYLRITKDRK